MTTVTITNPTTGDSEVLELEIRIGQGSAVIRVGHGALWDLIGEWSPEGVGNIAFDLRCDGTTLRGCRVSRVSATMVLEFLERE